MLSHLLTSPSLRHLQHIQHSIHSSHPHYSPPFQNLQRRNSIARPQMVIQQNIIDTKWSLEWQSVGQDVGLSQYLLQGLMRLWQVVVSHVQHSNGVQ